jgi:hypothetical protein
VPAFVSRNCVPPGVKSRTSIVKLSFVISPAEYTYHIIHKEEIEIIQKRNTVFIESNKGIYNKIITKILYMAKKYYSYIIIQKYENCHSP